MSHRIEIELTSRSGDGTWTWRAAGAKQPRGTVADDLVPDGTAVGTVLRAEVESTLDGMSVIALLPTKTKSKDSAKPAERIEILGTPRSGPDVSVVLASKSKGRRRDGDRDRPDRDRPGRDRPDGSRRPSAGRARSEPAASGSPSPRGEGRGRAGGPSDERRRERPARPGGREGTKRTGGRDGSGRPQPSTAFRDAALAALRPEQRPVAEQLLRGGIPAVRQAINEQNERARGDGRAEVTPGPLMAMAEELLPAINLANWKDRASSARTAGKDVALRELRSIVASSSTVNLDEEGRELATALRTSLDQRVTALRDGWVARMTTALDEGRVADALRISARPPEPAARLSAELAVRLSEQAGLAMSAETEAAAWLAVLEVVVESPVRRTVKPAGLPADADEALLAAARQASGMVPELARLLGIPIPPPPGPRRPVPARSSSGRRTA
ncbi:MAG TPA: hypothetical protein VHZ02_01575 [Acidimicrobiales bacterium]|jgi:hypothetical protein|nr:hypothetical protein [Acidimicrobiales bacterium]